MKSDLPKNLQNFGANDNRKINASLKDIMDDYENKVIKGLIKEYGATAEAKVKISEILDINLATLYRKLNKYNL